MDTKKGIIIAGAIVGIFSALLVKFGNPGNMGVCIACFLRDISGSLGLHQAKVVQYIRPEVVGIVIGAFISSMFFKEFKPSGGSSSFTRFLLAIGVMIGALVFLGCPLRMILRIAGGDLNAIIGLIGFVIGIFIGILFLNNGFSLKRNYKQGKFEASAIILLFILLFVLLIVKPSFIFFSQEGPGSMHAPIILALLAGLLTGYFAQRSRLCMVGGIRDFILFKETYLLLGFASIFLFTLIPNLIWGNFHLGLQNQPVAHSEAIWNFLSMILVGWGSVLLGGCPLRQLILSAEGNSDSSITIMGFFVGAAIAHNFALASSPKGVTPNGKIAVFLIAILFLIISYLNIQKFSSNKKGEKLNA